MTRLALLCLPAAVFCGCSSTTAQPAGAKPAPPVKIKTEADLSTITLTAQAEQRLGIQTAEVAYKAVARALSLAGEVTLPPGQAWAVTAPVAGTLAGTPPLVGASVRQGDILFRLLPLLPVQRDLRVNIDAEIASAAARLETSQARAVRAERLLRDKVGSVRAVEDAQQEVKLAETALTAAKAKLAQLERTQDTDAAVSITAPHDGLLRQIHAAPGQTVGAGAPLFEMASLAAVWVRVPVYAGEVAAVERGAAASVRRLHDSPAAAVPVQPVEAPPSADPLAATVDLFYQLPNRSLAFRPGEKVQVEIPTRGRQQSLQVPWSAIVFDYHGAAWLYENTAPHTYIRRRVELDRVAGGMALLSRGPKPGVKVVTAGVAELFGTEFGAGK